MTPARPGPGSDALRETLAYYRDLGVAELYLEERSKEHEEKISLKVNRAGEIGAAGSAAAMQAEPRSSFTFEEKTPYGSASPAARRASALELKSLAKTVSSCVTCRLCKTRKQTVFSDGSPEARIMFIGEAPGADEDAQGVPFVGRAGQLLTRMIEDGMGLPRSSVYIANVLKCRPPDNRNPEPDEIASCRGYLERQIDLVKPEVIVALGKFAAQFLLETEEGIMRLRGKWGSYRGIPVMPTFHPSFLLRQPAQKKEAWEDLLAVLAKLGIEAPARRGKPT
ncbi:MAG: uracil-DNA glycosylase [Thermoanaerobaculia bacterium]|nr:uracil-DNA glycosylase [Thermoanaerobaculia bacterium]